MPDSVGSGQGDREPATAAYCSTHGWWQASTGCAECVALAAEFSPWAEVSREIAERTFEGAP